MSTDRDKGGAKLRAPVQLPTDLGAFLFADVGVGLGGFPFTILSVLARLGLDPWDEAGRLAKQPDQEASNQLARILSAQSGTPPADANGVAARLVALLPGRAAPSRLSLRALPIRACRRSGAAQPCSPWRACSRAWP